MRALIVAAAVLVLAPVAASSEPQLRVVASRLENPRKLFVGHGALYVVEAGRGGRDRCVRTGSERTCIGLTGAVTRVAQTTARRVVTGLWSGARTNGSEAEGPADVVVRGTRYYVLLQDGAIDRHGFNFLGPDGAVAGDLISTPRGRASPTVLANFAAFEARNNPDRGVGPGAKGGDPAIDSDPYAFTAYRNGFAVVDAAGNDLLWLAPDGRISVLAVFPAQKVDSKLVQSVPTCVTVGPDGALYVGELTGVPYPRGKARVWRVVPGHKPTVYGTGFTNISDIAFDGRDLLVLELASKGLLDPTSGGSLLRLTPKGKRRVIASAGLVDPAGLAVAGGRIYISNRGLSPTAGEIVSLPA